MLKGVRDLLGPLSFRIFDKNLRIESTFNSALYDALMIGVSKLQRENSLKIISVKDAQQALANLVESDEQFRKSISLSTSDESQIKYRVGEISKLFKK